MAKSDKKKSKKLKVSFKDVETRKKVPDGQYHAKVEEVSVEDGNEHQYLKWTFEVMDPEYKSAKLYTNTSLAPQALWNLRSLLDALGVETPDDEFELDLPSYVGLEVNLTVENETYEGKQRPKVTDYSPLDETAEAEDDEEKSDDEDEEASDDDDEEEESEDEESDDDEEAEEDDEEEAPPPKKDGKKKAKKVTEDEVKEMDLDEMKDLLKKHGLKVKGLDDMRASKQVAAVIDALEGADLLAD